MEAVGQCGKVFNLYSYKELESSSVGPDQVRALNCASSGAFCSYFSKSSPYTMDSSMGNLFIRQIYGILKFVYKTNLRNFKKFVYKTNLRNFKKFVYKTNLRNFKKFV